MGYDSSYCIICYSTGGCCFDETTDYNLCLDCVHNKILDEFHGRLFTGGARHYSDDNIKYYSMMCDCCGKNRKPVYANMPVCKRSVDYYNFKIKEKKVFDTCDIKNICIECFETKDKHYDTSESDIEIVEADCEICTKTNVICLCFT
jgi:hypothetical protein